MFLEEISKMMYVFGDVRRPNIESVMLMQKILREQMNFLLNQAENIAYNRGSDKEISHEDILFLMRKNKMKIKRMLEYLGVLDSIPQFENPLDSTQDVCTSAVEGERVKKCLEFLALIEDCDEFTSFMQDKTVVDIVARKRKMRRYWMTNMMDCDEYKEFSEISLEPLDSAQSFKPWLLEDKVINLDITDCAVSMLDFLARETIAEIVDMVLLIKMKKLGKYLPLQFENIARSIQELESSLEMKESSDELASPYKASEDYSSNAASNDDYSSYGKDSEGHMMENTGENLKYFEYNDSREIDVSSSNINEISNELNPDQNCSQSQNNEKSPEEVSEAPYNYLSFIKAAITDISDDEITYLPGGNETDKNNDLQLKRTFELLSVSNTELLTPWDGSAQSSPLNPESETAVASTSDLSPLILLPHVEDISDISDSETLPDKTMSQNDPKSSTSENDNSFKTFEDKLAEDKSAPANYLSVSAKNEVIYLSPIEPEEILEAFALFQEPSPVLMMFVTHQVPRKTKLICLADSLSFNTL